MTEAILPNKPTGRERMVLRLQEGGLDTLAAIYAKRKYLVGSLGSLEFELNHPDASIDTLDILAKRSHWLEWCSKVETPTDLAVAMDELFVRPPVWETSDPAVWLGHEQRFVLTIEEYTPLRHYLGSGSTFNAQVAAIYTRLHSALSAKVKPPKVSYSSHYDDHALLELYRIRGIRDEMRSQLMRFAKQIHFHFDQAERLLRFAFLELCLHNPNKKSIYLDKIRQKWRDVVNGAPPSREAGQGDGFEHDVIEATMLGLLYYYNTYLRVLLEQVAEHNAARVAASQLIRRILDCRMFKNKFGDSYNDYLALVRHQAQDRKLSGRSLPARRYREEVVMSYWVVMARYGNVLRPSEIFESIMILLRDLLNSSEPTDEPISRRTFRNWIKGTSASDYSPEEIVDLSNVLRVILPSRVNE
ncbi:MAG: hypothetical protein AAGJ10_11465 [Bacteroidota bacterium]